MWWNVVPAFHPASLYLTWMSGLAVVGVGGVWTAAFLRELSRHPMLPLHDPELADILAAGAEAAS
jgi:hypothetical protein